MDRKRRIAVVGPLPPPSGGMARQTAQQIELITEKGHVASVIPTNLPYQPAFVEKLKGIRAVVRLMHYLVVLFAKLRQVDVVHIMANSGWSWYLFAVPAILVAKIYGIRTIVNYRGGEAETFFAKAWHRIRPVLTLADEIVVPSAFLEKVFSDYGCRAKVVPNTLDRRLFSPTENTEEDTGPWTILVARNLEAIYDVEMAILTLDALKKCGVNAVLKIAGSGPEEAKLRVLVQQLGLENEVTFLGRLDKQGMVSAYQHADVLLNTSRIDNSPNALIEAMSCGLPIVTSAVGGIPFLVSDRHEALLANQHEPAVYASLLQMLCEQPTLRESLIKNGLETSKRFDKEEVIKAWQTIYFQGESHLHLSNIERVKAFLSRAYTSLVAQVLFPFHEFLKKHNTVAVHKQMEKRQWWRSNAIEAYQLSELKRFLCDVYRDVPYYRELFDSHQFAPEKISSINDLSKLPFLTKSVIRENEVGLKATNATGLAKFNTGGSSGEPLIFFIGKERVSHDVAAKWRATRWWDVNIGDKEIVLWGSPIELGKQDKIKEYRDRLLRTQLISAFNLNDTTKREILEKIIQHRPPMLFGYPSVYYLLANYAEENNINVKHCGISVIFVTSERLYDHQKAKIEAVFGAPVANGYGGRDAGFIAHACPEGHMHITADDIVVEIIDKNGNTLPKGESGEIVVTHMRTRDFPFIRYRTGDIGAIGTTPCACGRGLPILEKIEGRTTDFIYAEDGTAMHGLALIYHVREVEGVRNFKIEQMTRSHTKLYLQTDACFTPQSSEQIRVNFKKRLGENVNVEILNVDHIPAEKSGKYRYVVSHA